MPILFGLFTQRYARLRRQWALIGTLISAISLIVSSFSQSVWHLVLTQGILQGIGSTIVYSSTTIFMDDWFIRRKGIAFGIIQSVKSAVGAGTPILFSTLLSHVGFRNTLRIWSAITLATSIPLIFLLRFRLPPSSHPAHSSSPAARHSRRLSFKFLTHPTFPMYILANIIFSASYGLPQTYISTFAHTLGISSSRSALFLTALNIPSIFACSWFGLLSDGAAVIPFRKRPLSIPWISLLSAIGSCLPVFLLWGLIRVPSTSSPSATPNSSSSTPTSPPSSTSTIQPLTLLSLFALTYGFFSGGYSSTWGGIIRETQREAESHNEAIDSGLLWGLMNGGRGIGYVAGGLAGVKLLDFGSVVGGGGGGNNGGASSLASRNWNWAYATDFGSLIVFVGVGAVCGGCGGLGRWMKRSGSSRM